jgi:hypothetical protein
VICEKLEAPHYAVFDPRVTPLRPQNTFLDHPQAVDINNTAVYNVADKTLNCSMFRFLQNHLQGENVSQICKKVKLK